jgi:hypothetical protein
MEWELVFIILAAKTDSEPDLCPFSGIVASEILSQVIFRIAPSKPASPDFARQVWNAYPAPWNKRRLAAT